MKAVSALASLPRESRYSRVSAGVLASSTGTSTPWNRPELPWVHSSTTTLIWEKSFSSNHRAVSSRPRRLSQIFSCPALNWPRTCSILSYSCSLAVPRYWVRAARPACW